MFDRTSKSYHDQQELNPSIIERFADEFSAKYLRSCFSPDLTMRVRERDKPIIVEHSCAIGGSRRKFQNRAEVS